MGVASRVGLTPKIRLTSCNAESNDFILRCKRTLGCDLLKTENQTGNSNSRFKAFLEDIFSFSRINLNVAKPGLRTTSRGTSIFLSCKYIFVNANYVKNKEYIGGILE